RIPFVRDGGTTLRDSAAAAVAQGLTRKHVGLYAFRREALLRFASLPPTRLEKAESLEQLRAMENGMSISVVPVDGEAEVAGDNAAKDSNITTGKIYGSVSAKERRGVNLGPTVQVIPHNTDDIKASSRAAAKYTEVMIVEIGSTVEDIKSLPFLEAVRQFRQE